VRSMGFASLMRSRRYRGAKTLQKKRGRKKRTPTAAVPTFPSLKKKRRKQEAPCLAKKRESIVCAWAT